MKLQELFKSADFDKMFEYIVKFDHKMADCKTPTAKTGSATVALNTSMVLLPKTPMQKRYFDERVGYFNNRITEFTDPSPGFAPASPRAS